MKKYRLNLIYAIIAMVFIISLGVTSILAWLYDSNSISYNGQTSYFHINYQLWFEQDNQPGFGVNDIDASEYYIGNDDGENNLKVIQMSIGNKNAPNYIGKLRIAVEVDTNSEYYLRMKFANEYYVQKTSLTTQTIRYNTLNQTGDCLMPYNINSNWYYDSTSNYTYYTNIIDKPETIDVISMAMAKELEYNDFASATHENKYFVYLDIQIEFVQANRMYAIWNLDNIPKAS